MVFCIALVITGITNFLRVTLCIIVLVHYLCLQHYMKVPSRQFLQKHTATCEEARSEVTASTGSGRDHHMGTARNTHGKTTEKQQQNQAEDKFLPLSSIDGEKRISQASTIAPENDKDSTLPAKAGNMEVEIEDDFGDNIYDEPSNILQSYHQSYDGGENPIIYSDVVATVPSTTQPPPCHTSNNSNYHYLVKSGSSSYLPISDGVQTPIPTSDDSEEQDVTVSYGKGLTKKHHYHKVTMLPPQDLKNNLSKDGGEIVKPVQIKLASHKDSVFVERGVGSGDISSPPSLNCNALPPMGREANKTVEKASSFQYSAYSTKSATSKSEHDSSISKFSTSTVDPPQPTTTPELPPQLPSKKPLRESKNPTHDEEPANSEPTTFSTPADPDELLNSQATQLDRRQRELLTSTSSTSLPACKPSQVPTPKPRTQRASTTLASPPPPTSTLLEHASTLEAVATAPAVKKRQESSSLTPPPSPGGRKWTASSPATPSKTVAPSPKHLDHDDTAATELASPPLGSVRKKKLPLSAPPKKHTQVEQEATEMGPNRSQTNPTSNPNSNSFLRDRMDPGRSIPTGPKPRQGSTFPKSNHIPILDPSPCQESSQSPHVGPKSNQDSRQNPVRSKNPSKNSSWNPAIGPKPGQSPIKGQHPSEDSGWSPAVGPKPGQSLAKGRYLSEGSSGSPAIGPKPSQSPVKGRNLSEGLSISPATGPKPSQSSSQSSVKGRNLSEGSSGSPSIGPKPNQSSRQTSRNPSEGSSQSPAIGSKPSPVVDQKSSHSSTINLQANLSRLNPNHRHMFNGQHGIKPGPPAVTPKTYSRKNSNS